jgi:hypothetical protein
MKLCIAGSRGFYGPPYYIAARMAINAAVKKFNINATIDAVVSGMCPDSPDMIGVDLANEAGVPVEPFEARWSDLTVPGAVPKKRFRNGKVEWYNVVAGFQRNNEVAEYLRQHDHLIILLWDGRSPGTLNFKKHCERLKLLWDELIPTFTEAPNG